MTYLKTKNDTNIHLAGSLNPLVFLRLAKNGATLVACGLLGAAAILLGACTQTNTADNNRSSYTAARHSSLGSHIPQPDSADSASATAATTGLQQQQTEQLTQYGNVATQSAPTGGVR